MAPTRDRQAPTSRVTHKLNIGLVVVYTTLTRDWQVTTTLTGDWQVTTTLTKDWQVTYEVTLRRVQLRLKVTRPFVVLVVFWSVLPVSRNRRLGDLV